jgi:hypothetical protein
MVFNTTFNSISAISWWSVLLVGETQVAYALMKWVYTDEIDIKSDDVFLLELLRVATRFKLKVLQER